MGDEGVKPRLVELAHYIESHADRPLTLDQLAQRMGLSPSRLQRVFKEAFGLSPRQYQDGIRQRLFRRSLQEGTSVTDAIYNSGFGSVSRVYGEASRRFGMTPVSYREGGKGEEISYACCTTALGELLMAATDKGVCFVHFGETAAALLSKLEDEFPQATLEAASLNSSSALGEWIEALNEYISTQGPSPDLPLDMRGTAFQMLVWRFLLKIPEGEVVSYTDVAAGIGRPNAVRAVATACGRNRIGILIPCHRVLRGDGSLGGYRWGLERKQALLDQEKNLRLRPPV